MSGVKPKHTPEPWSINAWTQGDSEIRIGRVGTPRICTVNLRDVSINEQKANADRIVACVNGCKGIADPSEIPALLEAVRALRESATNFNRGLLDAIEAVDEALANVTGED